MEITQEFEALQECFEDFRELLGEQGELIVVAETNVHQADVAVEEAVKDLEKVSCTTAQIPFVCKLFWDAGLKGVKMDIFSNDVARLTLMHGLPARRRFVCGQYS